MIVKITGIVSEIAAQSVTLERDGIAREILVPRYALGELAAYRGREVTLHTLEFLEGNAAGGNMVPRMVGFLHPKDRAFFNRFTNVKGIGTRKALKALCEPIAAIAGWIKSDDARSLAKLAGIGKRGAEMILAELRGKIEEFATGAPGVATADIGDWSRAQRDAAEVMVAWGDSRNDVERWLERAAQLRPDLSTPDEWVKSCYRIKAGAEG